MDGDFMASKLSQAQGIKCCKPRSETTTLNLALGLLYGAHSSYTETFGVYSLSWIKILLFLN